RPSTRCSAASRRNLCQSNPPAAARMIAVIRLLSCGEAQKAATSRNSCEGDRGSACIAEMGFQPIKSSAQCVEAHTAPEAVHRHVIGDCRTEAEYGGLAAHIFGERQSIYVRHQQFDRRGTVQSLYAESISGGSRFELVHSA